MDDILRRYPKTEVDQFFQPVEVSNLSALHQDRLRTVGHTRIGKNAKCPCGSGKKFKRCCMTAQA